MPEVKFEEDFANIPTRNIEPKRRFDLEAKLISWGIIGDRKHARYILIGVIVTASVLATFLFYRATVVQTLPDPDRESISLHYKPHV